ncbi:uncharacterized protein MYCFIDRAFT_204534 [Pseudocercospora fijiensis CIRAD86]|uniref:Uncharacterized protein n=1 Tax=Pseudocercospora fijiensis (strain CIRAD86) TaxID=383855 RepID=M2YRH1_PSEFD|nr:uncharacterized protein MYCFIDRAFT_204534 [Pseudocercospora fijiensis CIRAD86]EME80295.1 hypothetical protein MYCFIDRAFT_204534 [Pseudocercospora fijiensis CIRAD86]
MLFVPYKLRQKGLKDAQHIASSSYLDDSRASRLDQQDQTRSGNAGKSRELFAFVKVCRCVASAKSRRLPSPCTVVANAPSYEETSARSVSRSSHISMARSTFGTSPEPGILSRCAKLSSPPFDFPYKKSCSPALHCIYVRICSIVVLTAIPPRRWRRWLTSTVTHRVSNADVTLGVLSWDACAQAEVEIALIVSGF